MLDVNVLGMVRTARAALPHLREAAAARPGTASITHTCSIAATAGLPQRALYSASKGAVLSLTLAMAADHVREGVRVNCVNPGTADTPWIGRLLDEADDPAAERAALNARQPLGRLVTADEVAAAIVYLAGPSAASVTGTALAVDGGMQGLRLRRRTEYGRHTADGVAGRWLLPGDHAAGRQSGTGFRPSAVPEPDLAQGLPRGTLASSHAPSEGLG